MGYQSNWCGNPILCILPIYVFQPLIDLWSHHSEIYGGTVRCGTSNETNPVFELGKLGSLVSPIFWFILQQCDVSFYFGRPLRWNPSFTGADTYVVADTEKLFHQ
ncbi:unnamed protein product [Lactuca virosa]|uniref:Uncharacterized protein n=1 Tax=Lactuca virosa TaxID=75947 RepID=A0AAU9LL03_9ASTR|nr:unnamed protein product [Lactuca virosa]